MRAEGVGRVVAGAEKGGGGKRRAGGIVEGDVLAGGSQMRAGATTAERGTGDREGPGTSGPAVSRDAAPCNFAGGRERAGPSATRSGTATTA